MLERPKACPTDFYKLMCNCWTHDAEQRPTFDELCHRLPSLMPQILISITDSLKTNNSKIYFNNYELEHLQYAKGDLIVLLDKL